MAREALPLVCQKRALLDATQTECQDGWDTDDGQFDNDVLLYAPTAPKLELCLLEMIKTKQNT